MGTQYIPLWVWALGISALIVWALKRGKKNTQRKDQQRLQAKTKQVIKGKVTIPRMRFFSQDRFKTELVHNVEMCTQKGFQLVGNRRFYIYWNGRYLYMSNYPINQPANGPGVRKGAFIAEVTVDLERGTIYSEVQTITGYDYVEIDWAVDVQ